MQGRVPDSTSELVAGTVVLVRAILLLVDLRAEVTGDVEPYEDE